MATVQERYTAALCELDRLRLDVEHYRGRWIESSQRELKAIIENCQGSRSVYIDKVFTPVGGETT